VFLKKRNYIAPALGASLKKIKTHENSLLLAVVEISIISTIGKCETFYEKSSF
jgi:hypothetical protein